MLNEINNYKKNGAYSSYISPNAYEAIKLVRE
jgi:hypothetical protein